VNECDISIVAVSWNSLEFLPSALDSVPDACGPLSWQIIVVDNGSEDGSVDALRARGIDVVALDRNTGFTHAANVGASRSSGRYLLFLNPDVVLRRGSLAELASELDEWPAAWAATPWFRNLDGSPQHFWRRLPTAVTAALCFTHRGRRLDSLLGGRARRRHHYGELPDRPPTMSIETVGAACLLVRRAAFDAAGGYDERYFNFFQDTALARAMRRSGRHVLGVGKIDVAHHLGVSFKQLPPPEVHGQLLYALRQYLAGEPWVRRVVGGAAIWLDTVGRGEDGKVLRAVARRPV
jgi:GT2 family glycosyltransferase